jgi:hypothetical protein
MQRPASINPAGFGQFRLLRGLLQLEISSALNQLSAACFGRQAYRAVIALTTAVGEILSTLRPQVTSRSNLSKNLVKALPPLATLRLLFHETGMRS